jgi:hypothetical protein
MNDLSTLNSSGTREGPQATATPRLRAGLLLGVLVLISPLLSHCCSRLHGPEQVPNRPVVRSFDTPAPVLREAVIRVLVRKSFVLDAEHCGPLHLQTRWLQDGRHRSMVEADLSRLPGKRSELSLYLSLQKRALWGETWHQVEVIERWAYDDLLEAVVMEIYRVLYDRA